MTHTKLLAACTLSLTAVAQQQSEYHDEIMEELLRPCFAVAVMQQASLTLERLNNEQMEARVAYLMDGPYSSYADTVYVRAHNAIQGKDDPADRKAILSRHFLVCASTFT